MCRINYYSFTVIIITELQLRHSVCRINYCSFTVIIITDLQLRHNACRNYNTYYINDNESFYASYSKYLVFKDSIIG